MKVINHTTVPLQIDIFLFIPASSNRASFRLEANQTQVLQFNDPPPASGSLSVYQVYRSTVEGDTDECLIVPADATVTFSSEVRTGLFGNS